MTHIHVNKTEILEALEKMKEEIAGRDLSFNTVKSEIIEKYRTTISRENLMETNKTDSIESQSRKQNAKKSLPYLYAAILAMLWGRSIVLPMLKFYGDVLCRVDVNVSECGDFKQGILMGSAFFFFCLGSYACGPLSDRFGRKPIIVFSLIGMALGFFLQGIAINFWMLVGARCFTGIFLAVPAVCQAYISDCVELSELPAYTATLGKCWGITWATGPLISLGLKNILIWITKTKKTPDGDHLLAYRSCAIFAGLVNFVMIFIVWAKLEESEDVEKEAEALRREQEEEEIQAFEDIEHPFKKQNNFLLHAVVGAGFFIDHSLNAHHSLYCQLMVKFTEVHFAFIFALWGVGYTLVQFFYPKLEEIFGPFKVQLVAGLVQLFSITYIPFVAWLARRQDPWVQFFILLPGTLLFGCAYGIYLTGASCVVGEIAPPSRVADWEGYLMLFQCLGDSMILPVGYVGSHTNNTYNAFFICIGMVFIGNYIYLIAVLVEEKGNAEFRKMGLESKVSGRNTVFGNLRAAGMISLAAVRSRNMAYVPISAFGVPLLSAFSSPLQGIRMIYENENRYIVSENTAEDFLYKSKKRK